MKRGFTLIELLIVVAIIAILAAIAVPNFLEAQTRAKVSRAKSDMRTLATGLEPYMIDNNVYPLCNNEMLPGRRWATDPDNGAFLILERLSTPIAYLTTGLMADPFQPDKRVAVSNANPTGTPANFNPTPGDKYTLQKSIKYGAIALTQGQPGIGNFADVNSVAAGRDEKAKAYLLYVAGPDRVWAGTNGIMTSKQDNTVLSQFYDPTNGTVSYGDIWRAGGQSPADAQAGVLFFRHLFAIGSSR